MGVKFDEEEGTAVPLLHAKCHPPSVQRVAAVGRKTSKSASVTSIPARCAARNAAGNEAVCDNTKTVYTMLI